MVSVRIQECASLCYGDPKGFLIDLRKLKKLVATSGNARSHQIAENQWPEAERELRNAALFCFGMSECIGREIRLSPREEQDFDFVATWFCGDTQNYCPVQLTEVVPQHLNPSATAQGIVDALTRLTSQTSPS